MRKENADSAVTAPLLNKHVVFMADLKAATLAKYSGKTRVILGSNLTDCPLYAHLCRRSQIRLHTLQSFIYVFLIAIS